MKKIVLILIMICFLPLSTQAADFIFDTGIRWGMAQKDVLRIEKNRGSKTKDKSAAQAVVEAQYREYKGVRVTYTFTDKALSGAEYTLRYGTTAFDGTACYRDYLNLIADLTDSYGKPKKEALNWKVAETLRTGFEDQGKVGMAVTMGYLEGEAVWDVTDKNTQIRVFMFSPGQLMGAVQVTYTKM